jgi:hypothetical protein
MAMRPFAESTISRLFEGFQQDNRARNGQAQPEYQRAGQRPTPKHCHSSAEGSGNSDADDRSRCSDLAHGQKVID